MRKVLTFALLFGSAAAVQAQEPVTQELIEPVTQEAVAPVTQDAVAPASAEEAPVRTDDSPVPVVDLKTRSAAAAAVDAATLRAPVDADDTTQDIDAPRNFWWLVGAIVLAGVILAVLL